MNRIVLIPAYCPEKNLPSFVHTLYEHNCRVIILDDGSPVEYQSIFQQCCDEAFILHYTPNHGKGYALRTGMAWIQKNIENGGIVITADADGQHAPEDIDKCAYTAEKYPDSLVLGIRNFHQEGIPFKSKAGNLITEKIFKLACGVSVHDTQTGLRAFSTTLIHSFLTIEGDRYEYEMNQLLYCVENRIPFKQMEIRTIYENDNASSHFHPVRDSFLIYRKLLCFALSSFSSFLVDYGLFSLFTFLSSHVLLANICARLISASFNYEINKRYVFKQKDAGYSSLVKYAFTAVTVLVCNTMILAIFTDILHINPMIGKLMTELILFIFSWTVQKTFVFKPQKGVLPQ